MKYIKTYENFKPIKINSAKPFKIKKNLDRSIQYVQKGIKSLRRRLDIDPKQSEVNKHAKMSNDKNAKIQKLKDLTFKKLKQQEYLRNNPPIKENVENDKNLIEVLSSPDFKGKDIVNYIGLDEKEYEIEIDTEYNYQNSKWEYNYSDKGVKILMKTETLEDLMEIEHGVLQYFMQFTGYNNYEYDVDSSELNYLHRYLSDEQMKKIKKLSKLFKTNIKIKETKYNECPAIPELFKYLGLKDKLDDFKAEISMENERALEKSACAELKLLPFELNYKYGSGRDNFDKELYFDYEDLIEYMKKHDLEVKTIKELLENIDNADQFTWHNEYEKIAEYLGDFDDLKRSVESVVDDCLKSPDDVYPKLIIINNLEAFKNNLEFADFKSVYNYKYESKRLTLFEIAKKCNNKITDWLSSKEFEKFIMAQSSEEIDNYQEFILGEDVRRYNL